MSRWRRFKQKWQIGSDWQGVVILIVFAVTGSTSAALTRPLLVALGIDAWPWYFRWPVGLVLILPVYNVLLLIIGGLLGQFRFFWHFEKRTFGRFFRRS